MAEKFIRLLFKNHEDIRVDVKDIKSYDVKDIAELIYEDGKHVKYCRHFKVVFKSEFSKVFNTENKEIIAVEFLDENLKVLDFINVSWMDESNNNYLQKSMVIEDCLEISVDSIDE